MTDKKFVAIVLAVGLLLSIGCVMSQQRTLQLEEPLVLGSSELTTDQAETGTPTQQIIHFKIDRYSIMQLTTTFQRNTIIPNQMAIIDCVSDTDTQHRAEIIFLKDDAPSAPNRLDNSIIVLYYHYSQYNDILAILQRGGAMLHFNMDNPEASRIDSGLG